MDEYIKDDESTEYTPIPLSKHVINANHHKHLQLNYITYMISSSKSLHAYI